ncbi:hypothetical protein F2Q69_00011421 [Brassica cretica]|uniref:Uncharacterized protein n=1 Tax=Brassica cretica TaxID=69181 RepID=A0A8S9QXP0_BRACR|nr:hypothetical protein F2Q69_00011421 [Brassica cretica]
MPSLWSMGQERVELPASHGYGVHLAIQVVRFGDEDEARTSLSNKGPKSFTLRREKICLRQSRQLLRSTIRSKTPTASYCDNESLALLRRSFFRSKQGVMEAVDDPDLSFSKIMKDVQHFASSHMTWKDKKTLENQKVTGLGGKNMIFGQFGGTSRKKPAEKKRKPEERVLKSTFGNFRGGVLDVKDLLRSGSSSRTNNRDNNYGENKNKSKGMGEVGGGGRDIKKNRKKKAKKGGGKRKSK